MSPYTYELCVMCETKGYKLFYLGECSTCRRAEKERERNLHSLSSHSTRDQDYFEHAKEIVRMTYGA